MGSKFEAAKRGPPERANRGGERTPGASNCDRPALAPVEVNMQPKGTSRPPSNLISGSAFARSPQTCRALMRSDHRAFGLPTSPAHMKPAVARGAREVERHHGPV